MGKKSSIESSFDVTFTAALAQREKQIQQNYRPIIGVHKWFARRPGTVFRNLLLAEFNGDEDINVSYWKSHQLSGVIADPFMGGGTPIFEANRLGFSVIGTDINPMAYWIVRQSLAPLEVNAFKDSAENIIADVKKKVGSLYKTTCIYCDADRPVKYFIWVKTAACPECETLNDLFPGYLLAEARRHPKNVVACNLCGHLNEYDFKPSIESPEPCENCGHSVYIQGAATRNKISCKKCDFSFRYPSTKVSTPPKHRLWAIEYYCSTCKAQHKGRFFKKPDEKDLSKFERAKKLLNAHDGSLPLPDEEIPHGDETRRLHNWGYKYFRDMFNERQLLGLGLLLQRILEEHEMEIRHALLTVFSDFVRYQNMLCRYDTYALKCQDIFSVHGFPVGLVQCENNLLGIPKIGSGAFSHFVEKYANAKLYCLEPFETKFNGRKKEKLPIKGEKIEAEFVDKLTQAKRRQACIKAATATDINLSPNSLDGVFTDPPYYNNVQYAELMDFCFTWLRLGLKDEFDIFKPSTTRAHGELTGNISMNRGLDHFTEGLSEVFTHYATALKEDAPFVFTYHHNDPMAYIPLVVAILDAGLDCSATIPAPAEMGASLHIARSKSSVLDSIFVCRKRVAKNQPLSLHDSINSDIENLTNAGLKISEGDLRCLAAGHIARVTINKLRTTWDKNLALQTKMSKAKKILISEGNESEISSTIKHFLDNSCFVDGGANAAAI